MLMAYLDAMPSVMAEDNMRQSTIVAMGSGTLEKSARRDIMSAWRRGMKTEPSEKLPLALRKVKIAMMGIKVG